MKRYMLCLKIKRYVVQDHGNKPRKGEYFHIIEDVFVTDGSVEEPKLVTSWAGIRSKAQLLAILGKFDQSLETPRSK